MVVLLSKKKTISTEGSDYESLGKKDGVVFVNLFYSSDGLSIGWIKDCQSEDFNICLNKAIDAVRGEDKRGVVGVFAIDMSNPLVPELVKTREEYKPVDEGAIASMQNNSIPKLSCINNDKINAALNKIKCIEERNNTEEGRNTDIFICDSTFCNTDKQSQYADLFETSSDKDKSTPKEKLAVIEESSFDDTDSQNGDAKNVGYMPRETRPDTNVNSKQNINDFHSSQLKTQSTSNGSKNMTNLFAHNYNRKQQNTTEMQQLSEKRLV